MRARRDAGTQLLGARPGQRTKRLNLDWGPDARPKIVVDRKGGIALAFSIFRDEAFNGQVLYTRSGDGGKSFAEARPITANNESQRFEALARSGWNGLCGMAGQAQSRPREGERDGIRGSGAVLRLVARWRRHLRGGEACAMTTPANAAGWGWHSRRPGGPAVIFRNIFEGGVRDHAVMTFADVFDAGGNPSGQQ